MANTWLSPERVAARLEGGVDVADETLIGACDGIAALVSTRRSDLDFTDASTVPDDVMEGSVQWAALTYQQRNSPTGFAGFGDVGDGFATAWTGIDPSKRAEIRTLVGWYRPVAL